MKPPEMCVSLPIITTTVVTYGDLLNGVWELIASTISVSNEQGIRAQCRAGEYNNRVCPVLLTQLWTASVSIGQGPVPYGNFCAVLGTVVSVKVTPTSGPWFQDGSAKGDGGLARPSSRILNQV